MSSFDAIDADLAVALTPRQSGGHEVALFGWLGDAVREHGLRPLIVTGSPALAAAWGAAGLADGVLVGPTRWPRMALLRQLLQWPAGRPLLLAPGVLHVDAWLLAAVLLMRRHVWVYVPMAFTAQRMGFRLGRLRDLLIAPWLRAVDAWVVIDERQAGLLAGRWRVTAPIHVLPNRARVAGGAPPSPPPAPDGRLRIAWVGRFEPWQKGLDWLSAALQSDPAWAERSRWRFQGRGAGEPLLRELAARLGPQTVTVHAHAPLDEALEASDVLLLASRFEGLPLVALEAIERGWPVVATRACGLDDLLPAASLFECGDLAGLARALESLRSAPARQAAADFSRARWRAAATESRYRAALQALVVALRRPAQPMSWLARSGKPC